MHYILDTNIILSYIRKSELTNFIDEKYAPLSNQNIPIISIVSIGEIKSLAIQNKWGKQKLKTLYDLINKFVVSDINVEEIVDHYSKIDAFSQGKLPNRPVKFTSRNMGKNDLWIAATSSVLGVQLLTTDKDFEHLKDEFIDVEIIDLL